MSWHSRPEDMDVLKFSVGTLPKPLAVIRDSKCLSISHGLDQIAVLSKGNEAVVIPVSPSVQFVGDCLWKGSKSCSRLYNLKWLWFYFFTICTYFYSLLFSENSNEFAVLTKDFDLQIFTIRQGRKFTEVAKKNLRQSRFISMMVTLNISGSIELIHITFSSFQTKYRQRQLEVFKISPSASCYFLLIWTRTLVRLEWQRCLDKKICNHNCSQFHWYQIVWWYNLCTCRTRIIG